MHPYGSSSDRFLTGIMLLRICRMAGKPASAAHVRMEARHKRSYLTKEMGPLQT